MNPITIFFLSICSFLILILPKRYAIAPFLLCTCYITRGQSIDLGPFSFSALRILILVGFLRLVIRGEILRIKFYKLDYLIILWAIIAWTSSAFYNDRWDSLVFRLGITYDALGIYFLVRHLIESTNDFIFIFRVISIILAPVALEMVYEKINSHNLFSFLGGVPPIPQIRINSVRAQGPFGHPILAGTVGSICLPYCFALFRYKFRIASLVGFFSCTTIIFCSSSSGPILSAIAGIVALCAWNYRQYIHLVKYCSVFFYLILEIVMKDPAYYILARIDITGGSTGWHRARLIDNAFRHIGEWWLAGTDYTRHWMPTGVSWSPDHADITNYYLKMGVIGGLPLMIMFISIFLVAFHRIGILIRSKDIFSINEKFLLWSIASSLFCIAATSISVSFFDQSFLFVYLNFASICSFYHLYENENKKSRSTSDAIKR